MSETSPIELPLRRWQEFTSGVKLTWDDLPHNEAHPGFAAVQSKIEGEGYSAKAAGAILASKTRNASKAAKKANPRLKRVKG